MLGADNIADLMTQNLAADVIAGYLAKMKLKSVEGRSNTAEQLHSMEGVELLQKDSATGTRCNNTHCACR